MHFLYIFETTSPFPLQYGLYFVLVCFLVLFLVAIINWYLSILKHHGNDMVLKTFSVDGKIQRETPTWITTALKNISYNNSILTDLSSVFPTLLFNTVASHYLQFHFPQFHIYLYINSTYLFSLFYCVYTIIPTV